MEYIIVTEFNYEKLYVPSKEETEIDQQQYEDVPGFKQLSSGLQARTTAFSCSNNDDRYEENTLETRPLPWVVRVFFTIENSMRGTICSGQLMDLLRPTFEILENRPQFHLKTVTLSYNY